jgi:peroxiredoxin
MAKANSSAASGQFQVIKFPSTTTGFCSGIAQDSFANFSKLSSQSAQVTFLSLAIPQDKKFLGAAQILATTFQAFR